MTEFDKGQDTSPEMVYLTDEDSGEQICVPEWTLGLSDTMRPEERRIIGELFESTQDYLTALHAACADAREGKNLPQRLTEPTPLGIPHYRMQEVLHRLWPFVEARLEKNRQNY
jgi:hypothetical protein